MPVEQVISLNAPIEEQLRLLGPVIRRRVAAVTTGPDSCISSTRIAIDVLRDMLRRDAYALRVVCNIFNATFVAMVEQHGGMPDSREQVEEWHRLNGAHSIGLGHPDQPAAPGKWPGHLVVVVERKWLWDISINQAERPQHGMYFPEPVLYPIAEPFLRGRDLLAFQWRDMVLSYTALPADRSFKDTPDWRTARATVQEVR